MHELHHLARLSLFPWDIAQNSVTDYVVHEGLAESFAASLLGEDVLGHYVTDFNVGEIETARALTGDGLDRRGFDVIRGYIFGDRLAGNFGFEKVGMPDYGGYAIAPAVVKLLAEWALSGNPPDLLRPFGYERFTNAL